MDELRRPRQDISIDRNANTSTFRNKGELHFRNKRPIMPLEKFYFGVSVTSTPHFYRIVFRQGCLIFPRSSIYHRTTQ